MNARFVTLVLLLFVWLEGDFPGGREWKSKDWRRGFYSIGIDAVDPGEIELYP